MLKFLFKSITIVLILGTLAGAYILMDLFRDQDIPILKGQENSAQLNTLIVGFDAVAAGASRPDTIILLNMDFNKNSISLISIPRDTRVRVAGYESHYKLNSSYGLGGMDLFIDTIENLLNVSIQAYATVDFESFVRLIDIMGGVEIDVPHPMRYVDEAGGLDIDIAPGLQVLDGEAALDFVRYREPAHADIGRIRRQQDFIAQVLNQAISFRTILRTPTIINEINDMLSTNLSLKDIVSLARIAIGIPREEVEMVILPGTPEYINGVAYWVVDQRRMERIVFGMIHTKDYLFNNKFELTLLNGSGIAGLAARTQEELIYWGFNIKEIGNAASFDHQYTTIFYNSGSLEGALKVSAIIGGAPRLNRDLDDGELLIILGRDQS